MKKDNLKEKIKETIKDIIKDAIEQQMDWDSYYEGSSEEPTRKIIELFDQVREETLKEEAKRRKKEKCIVAEENYKWGKETTKKEILREIERIEKTESAMSIREVKEILKKL